VIPEVNLVFLEVRLGIGERSITGRSADQDVVWRACHTLDVRIASCTASCNPRLGLASRWPDKASRPESALL